MVLSTLSGASAGFNISVDATVVTNTTRSGCELPPVGPMRVSS
jgi:hypothetical protein